MNKGELISNVAKSVNSNKQEVGKILDAILEEVQKSLKEGNDVTLVGFGTWKKKSRALNCVCVHLHRQFLYLCGLLYLFARAVFWLRVYAAI